MKPVLQIIIALTLSLIPLSGGAQIYVTDDILTDSVKVFFVTTAEDGTEMSGDHAFSIPTGETVTVERLLKGSEYEGIVRFDGKEFAMHRHSLTFSDENAEGTEDIFGDTRAMKNHTWEGRFFATLTPYILIAICFIGAILISILGMDNYRTGCLALWIVPLMILLGSGLEIWALSVIGKQTFWWCDSDRFGFWGSAIRMVPFALVVYAQLMSIIFYKGLLWIDKDDDVSLKPMAKSIILCIPVFLIVTVICAALHLPGMWQVIIPLSVSLVALSVGIIKSSSRNITALGKIGGLAFTAFGAIYIICACVAVVCLGIVLISNLIQTIVLLLILTLCTGKVSNAASPSRRKSDTFAESEKADKERWEWRWNKYSRTGKFYD